MDTTKLVVGEKVEMLSGPFGCEGKVVKVSPEGVEVEVAGFTPYKSPLHFDSNGKGRDDEGTHEAGVWHIDEMPYAERKALDKKQHQEYLAHPFPVWWKSATYEERLAVVKKYYDLTNAHRWSKMVPAEDIASSDDIRQSSDQASSFPSWAVIAMVWFVEWWRKATYDQRLVVVKKFHTSALYRNTSVLNSNSLQVAYPLDSAEIIAKSELSDSLTDSLVFYLAWFKS